MPKTVVIDELHLTFRVPAGLPEETAGAVRQTLDDPAFVARLRASVRAVVQEFPALVTVVVAVSR